MNNLLILTVNKLIAAASHTLDFLAHPFIIGFGAGCTLANLGIRTGIL